MTHPMFVLLKGSFRILNINKKMNPILMIMGVISLVTSYITIFLIFSEMVSLHTQVIFVSLDSIMIIAFLIVGLEIYKTQIMLIMNNTSCVQYDSVDTQTEAEDEMA